MTALMSMHPSADFNIPIPYLRECLSYDSETGALTWKQRPLEHFFNRRAWAIWNTKWAGKHAGALTEGILHVHLRAPGGQMRNLLGHRVGYALTHGHWPEHEVDHRNGVEAGDGINNLRSATHAENHQNRRKPSHNVSGYPGVFWSSRDRKWRASIKAGSFHPNIGYYATREQAYVACCAVKQIVHPFQPVPRGVPIPNLRALDRMIAAQRIRLAAGARGDSALALKARDHFLAALQSAPLLIG